MELRNIIILIFIIILLGIYFTENYKKMEKIKLIEISTIIKDDDNELYINPYLSNKEPNLNIVKKYNDNKINIINNLINNENKSMYDGPITSTNNNSNHNNLLHFINFLI